MNYDAWKTATAPESPEYDYDNYEGLPYLYDESLRRYRDPETGAFVSEGAAIEANDAECERRDRIDRERDEDYWLRD